MSPSRPGASRRRRRLDRPALGDRLRGDAWRDVAASAAAASSASALGAMRARARSPRRAGRLRPPRAAPQRDVVGLRGDGRRVVGRLGHQRAEACVDPVDDRVAGAEVGRELDHAAASAPKRSRGRQERGDVGPAEPVDRLLRVADDEQVAGRDRRRSSHGAARVGGARGRRRRCGRRARSGSGRCPGTRRAGAAGSGRAGAAADARPCSGSRSDRAGEHEQVVELELARLGAALGGAVERERAGAPQPSRCSAGLADRARMPASSCVARRR